MIGTRSTLVVQPLPSGERTIVQRGGYFGRYVDSGHIVYLQDDTLFAMPFDLRRLTVTGPPARTIDGIQSNLGRGSAQLALSQTGTMAYIPGRNTFDARPIAWMDRTGALATLRAEPADVVQRRILSRRPANRRGHSRRGPELTSGCTTGREAP